MDPPCQLSVNVTTDRLRIATLEAGRHSAAAPLPLLLPARLPALPAARLPARSLASQPRGNGFGLFDRCLHRRALCCIGLRRCCLLLKGRWLASGAVAAAAAPKALLLPLQVQRLLVHRHRWRRHSCLWAERFGQHNLWLGFDVACRGQGWLLSGARDAPEGWGGAELSSTRGTLAPGPAHACKRM